MHDTHECEQIGQRSWKPFWQWHRKAACPRQPGACGSRRPQSAGSWRGRKHGWASASWKDLIPTLAEATGSKIIAYDRAGFGMSDEVRLPFNLSSAVDDLTSGLMQLGATKDLILVPHSFAGEVAFGLAQIHRSWLYGAVFVDANLPNFYNADQTRRQYTESRPLGDKLVQKENSKRTRSIKAMLDAQLTTNTMFHRESWPSDVPVTVILSGKTPFDDALEVSLWKKANEDFARAVSNRSLIVATDSSHDIVSDNPNLIIEAVKRMVNTFHQTDH